MNIFRVALDWTPNVNHIGFFIASELGYYTDLGLNVIISDPKSDNYKITPAKKVEINEADIALCPLESVISYRTKKNKFLLIAIATILKNDLSAIVVKDSSIISPKYLDGKTYASYGARYEDKIIKRMIINDGGVGNIKINYPEKLGIWETIIKNKYDSTWIFLNWEGIEAQNLDINLNYFKMSDFDIPYSYSPVIVADERKIQKYPKDYVKFLNATKSGYLYCLNNLDNATKILKKYMTIEDNAINLEKALNLTNNFFGTEKDWGIMEQNNVKTFINWLKENQLIEKNIYPNELFTNSLLI
tara:strand:- start:263 stop:1168 length:906 start_codon:yes stop_codon:yes gene_type:complete